MLVCFSLLLCVCTQAKIIGIDLGTEFMKVALVAPRKPLEIVTNTASKRKTEMAINFDRGERSFGGDAVVMLGRKPEATFTHMTAMLGRYPEHPDVVALAPLNQPPMTFNETRGGITLLLSDRGDESEYYPEELVAMMLNHASDITKQFGYPVKDCVVAVPQHWTAFERAAFMDAASLSDLAVLSLIDDNTAAALQFGIDRPREENHNVLFYNMGAQSTQVSVVTYGPKIQADRNANVGQFTVKGKAWDSRLGGQWFDLTLSDLLADLFNKKWKKGDIRDFPKAMARIQRSAAKTKQVLSANMEIPVSIEQLHADIDFHATITRDMLEMASKPLLARVTNPITEALNAANMTLADINEVEVIGGAVRMPAVQDILKKFLAPLDLGVHINGDEAIALGAAFAGANASRAFQVRQVGMTDITPFALDVSLMDMPLETTHDEAEGSGGLFAGVVGSLFGGKDKEKENAAPVEEELYTKKSPLCAPGASLPLKKTFAITHERDLSVNITYAQENPQLPAGTAHHIASYNVTGVVKFAAEMKAEGRGLPKVSLKFITTPAGIPVLASAEAAVEYEKEVTYDEIVELPDEETATPADTETATTETPEGDAATDAEAPVESEGVEETETATDDTAAAKTEGDAKAADGEKPKENGKEGAKTKGKKKTDKKKKKKKTITVTKTKMVTEKIRRPLTITPVIYKTAGPRPMAEEDKKVSLVRLQKLKASDDARTAKAQAKNDLETYVLKVRGNMGDDLTKQLEDVTTEEQRTEMLRLANELEEWLYDEGWDEEASVYIAKKQSLSKIADAAYKRAQEAIARPAEVKRARLYMAKIRETVEKWGTTKPQVTEEEKIDLLEKLEKAAKWLDDKVDEQAGVAAHETPVFTSAEIEPKLRTVTSLVATLNKKPAPKAEKEKDVKDAKDTKGKAKEGAEGKEKKADPSEASTEAADGDDTPTIEVEEPTVIETNDDASTAGDKDIGDEGQTATEEL